MKGAQIGLDGGWDRRREGKGIKDRRGGGGEVVFWTQRHEPGNPIIQCLNRIGTSLLLKSTHTHTHRLTLEKRRGWPAHLRSVSTHINTFSVISSIISLNFVSKKEATENIISRFWIILSGRYSWSWKENNLNWLRLGYPSILTQCC